MLTMIRRTAVAAHRFRRAENGATAIEYGLIAALMAVTILSALQYLSGTNESGWNGTATKISNASESVR